MDSMLSRLCRRQQLEYVSYIISMKLRLIFYQFGAYEAAKNAFAGLEGHNDPHSINPYSKFVAGGAAGMVAQ